MDSIAIVGLGCVLPNALTVPDFWKNLVSGHVALTRVPARAWDHSLYLNADRTTPDRTPCDLGGFVHDFVFDWKKYKVPPADAQAVNAMQWMILEAGTQALSEVRRIPKDTTGIFLGATGLGWQKDSGLRIRLDDMLDAVRASLDFRALPRAKQDELLEVTARQLRARLKEVSEDNVVGASASVAAGRINMHFDLKGPHYSVDAGFASSLAALDIAVRSLRDGELDLAVAGGASELLTPLELIAFSKLGGLSNTGIRPFAEQADGTILGEGVALLALKRLADAERDGDTIYALIEGVGGSTDGKGKSLVAPRTEGQALAMQRALADAEAEPGSIRFVECHATGTQVGDASEVRALASVYGGLPAGSIAIGSVKANLGHLRSAAGAAGLLKAVLSLHHGEIPPQPSVHAVNPRLEIERTPFFVPQKPVPLTSATDVTYRAAVSSFSFGGNNFHAILEAYRPGRAARSSRRAAKQAEPLAIIGMGGCFPGAKSVPELWQRLLEGHDATRTIPPERWDIERYYDSKGERKDKAYTRIGCFLDELPRPDASLKVPPAAWPSLDPAQVLMLRSTEEALKDAGFSPDKWDRDRVALSLAFLPYQGKKFLADTRVHWSELEKELKAALEAARVPANTIAAIVQDAEARYKANLPPITEDTLTGYIGSLNAGRIASLYDFHGPHWVVDSACASSHAALHGAWKLLNHGEADVVITGGVWADMLPEFFVAACRFNALSTTGSFPYDARANGFIPGEGAAVLVVKRLSDAERDGDHIHAVIRSVAGSSDGKGRSVLAPSEAGEAMAMTRALAAAELPASSVEYVEGHGTGTALGDVVEAKATYAAYGEGRKQPIALGSIKSNIGHLNAAAGFAGMVKAALAVETGVIPASIKVENKNPKIPEGVDIVREKREWPAPANGPRRAGVSSFGVGGSNFHTIIEEYRPRFPLARPERPDESAESKLMALAGEDARACLAQLDALCQEGGPPLADTAVVPSGPFRMAVTARSQEELRKKAEFVRKAVEGNGDLDFLAQVGVSTASPESPTRGGAVAVLFPGQGGQYANMLRPLAAAYPVVQQTLEEADDLYRALAGRPLSASFYTDRPEAWQQSDEDIHAAVFLVNLALHRLLVAHGITPSFFIGQSAGELAALVAAGSLSFEEGLRAIRARTLAVLELPVEDPGQMVALSCSSDQVPALLAGLPGYAKLAADNGPRACIVSADKRAVGPLIARSAERNIEYNVLAVSHGYHSDLIGGARPVYQRVLETLHFRPPRGCLISTIDAQPYGDRSPAVFPAFLASQFVKPVLLRAAIRSAYDLGARVFIEAGPKWSLTQFTRETLKGRPHGAMASIHPKVGDMEQFKRLVGYTYVNEVGQLSPDAGPRNEHVATTQELGAIEVTAAVVEKELLQLPLENVLEPATALQVAIALGNELGVDASGAAAEDLQTLDAIVAFVERLVAGQTAPSVPKEAAMPPPPQPQQPPQQPPPQRSAATLAAEIERKLLDTVMAKTGYPEDMLGLDLDLEADLGIDTVKQVEIFALVRGHFGVPRDPNLTLRDFNTLRKVILHIRDRAIATNAVPAGAAPVAAPVAAPPAPTAARAPAPVASPPAPAAARAPAPVAPPPPPAAAVAAPQAAPVAAADLSTQVRSVLLQNVIEKTGYPEDMLDLDLDLEADLGIDTVKQVEIFARTREHFGVPRDPNLTLRDFNTLRKVVDHITARAQLVAAPVAAPAPKPAPAQVAPAAQPPPAAAKAPPAPLNGAGKHDPGSNGSGPQSVRNILLAMNLEKLGLGAAEKQRLAEALSSQLALPVPDVSEVRTLADLVQTLSKPH